MPKSLTVGCRPDCEIVISLPTVSGRHCRLTRDESGYVLEDLNSTNGTFFNGQRVVGSLRITLTVNDTIHLGSHPLENQRILALFDRQAEPIVEFRGHEMTIGRSADCDQVIDLPVVSSRHARLVRRGGQIFIEDLKSSNGTFVGGVRIETEALLKLGDSIALGSYRFVLSEASWIVAEQSPPVGEPGKSTLNAIVRAAGASWPLAALLAQAPLAALLATLLTGAAVPAVIFGLGLAAVWFGLSDSLLSQSVSAVLKRLGWSASTGPARLFQDQLALAALCAAQCFCAWLVASKIVGLHAASAPALGVLLLTSLVGLALGWVILAISPRSAFSWASAVVLVLCFWFLGGHRPPLRDQIALARPIAGLSPPRWAFEALLLLEAGESAVAGAPGEARAEKLDQAEAYFPADSLRMGTTADVLALALMLIGLSAAAVFLSTGTIGMPATGRLTSPGPGAPSQAPRAS
jgi:pSer/pThr/pTyr-binding forkhead associated (FHA) protein